MKSYVLTIWNFIDPIYYKFTRLTYIHKGTCDDNILRVRLTRYKGKNITLSDGTQINKNDTLIKIHLHNVRLLNEMKSFENNIKKGKFIYQYVKKSLPDLALYIQNHPKADKIKGIIGITMLNRGADRLGFEFVSISNPLYKWFKWIAFIPICLLSGNNSIIKMIKNNISSSPQYLFMSKESLLERYPYKSLHEVSKRR
ncbi:YkoP family protein [Bacillus cytotoxicus]|uniref:YkoP-like domain-containing protein n=2 Tax=Bacillus cytotoxicus TaxID=580165 RepID=A0AAX2CGN0_9BACI|nr:MULTISPECIES: hypothetical protein [Bacillus cereus group]ABS22012.1 conserved hypothetical protein [Bacillus cytotoxicus NVH 391-98]AWC28614.1 hypothetical protein CG483_009700 [Bacillus cytotoxicus]AWC40002.1 hypothetical protein CG480_005555 [Bacillus cytotoxicus]AWC44695.1 hypothetical protein CG479_009290 [Bacillus cytotoxicus]AWC47933.1 hypothetical protein CG478_005555 [Bacillus cytotoxicus]